MIDQFSDPLDHGRLHVVRRRGDAGGRLRHNSVAADALDG